MWIDGVWTGGCEDGRTRQASATLRPCQCMRLGVLCGQRTVALAAPAPILLALCTILHALPTNNALNHAH